MRRTSIILTIIFLCMLPIESVYGQEGTENVPLETEEVMDDSSSTETEETENVEEPEKEETEEEEIEKEEVEKEEIEKEVLPEGDENVETEKTPDSNAASNDEPKEETPPVVEEPSTEKPETDTVEEADNTKIDIRARKQMPSKKESIAIPDVLYRSHIQYRGWENNWKKNGNASGTSGQSLRLEGIQIKLSNVTAGSIEYRTHIQNIGWESTWKKNGATSGTTGRSLRLEAIQIRLTGELAKTHDIYYRGHAQNYGWLGWTKNGASAGTEGYSCRLEAIEIKLVKKGQSAPGSQSKPFIKDLTPKFNYQVHVQYNGWQSTRKNGAPAGTTGRSLRLEGIRIQAPTFPNGENGTIRYRTHIQNIGWENGWKSNNALSGTTGRSLRLEAIQLELTGEAKNQYDIYYRVHAQNFGWLGWTKNGASAGTEGYAYRLEAIEIKVVKKGTFNPAMHTAFYKQRSKVEIYVPYINQYAYGAVMGCEGAALLQSLQGKGYARNISYTSFLDSMPKAKNGNPNTGFVGSPYTDESPGEYKSIFPKSLAPYGNKYGTTVNITGYSDAKLVEELYAGNTSVVYVTYKFRKPVHKNFSFGRAVDNMHVMTLIGYNPQNDQFKVMDPAGLGSYWVSGSSFRTAYNATGKMAVLVK